MVGPWPARKAATLLEKYFEHWRTVPPGGGSLGWGGTPVQVTPHLSPPPQGGRMHMSIRLRASFEQAYLMTGTLAPAVGAPEALALKVLNTVLGGGMSSRLFLRLREELSLAYEVSSFFPTRLEPSLWVIYLGLPAQKISIARKKLQEILRNVRRRGISSAELAQAKQMIRGSFLMENQTRRRQAWYAAWWEFLGKPPGYGDLFLKTLDAIVPEQVHAVAKRMLDQPWVTVEVVPK
jgi:zinc protease